MPVSTAYSPITFAGDGVANAFPITWPYQFDTDIVVQTIVLATNTTTTLVLGTGYTVSPTTNSPAGTGTVTTPSPIPVGTDLVISRNVPITQNTSWVPNDPNLSTSTMNAVDKLTMIAQQMQEDPFNLGGDASTFLRGDNALSNTLIGASGTFDIPTDTSAVFIAGQTANAQIKTVCGSTSQGAFAFATDGSANAWDMRWVFDPQLQIIGSQSYGGAIKVTIDADGNVTSPATVTANALSGNIDASDITSGTVAAARLGSGSPTADTFLNGANQWAVPSGGSGGINTTTTANFLIANVAFTQTVSVTDATGMVVGSYIQISDGTHAIIGHVTAIASLDLTVLTDSIIAGSVGDTMASGAAVQAAGVPGNNTIQLSDAATSPNSVSRLVFQGSIADSTANSAGTVKLSIGEIPTAVHAYPVKETFDYDLFKSNVLPGVVAIADAGAASSLVSTSSADRLLISASSSPNIRFGQLTTGAVPDGLLTPAKLNATNSPTDTYVAAYDNATGHFTWVSNSSVPGSGTVAQFLIGDSTWSNKLAGGSEGLILAQDTTSTSVATIFNSAVGSLFSGSIIPVQYSAGSYTTITAAPWFSFVAPIACSTSTYPVSAIDGLHGQTESAFGMNVRAVGVFRGNSGFWNKIRYVSNPTGTQTIDPSTNSHVRFESILSDFTIGLADNTAVPATGGIAYAGEVTVEFINAGGHVVTWDPSIVWVDGGSGPQPVSTGTTIVKLLREQDAADGHGARWVGYQQVSSTSTYTDAQARSAVLSSSYLLNSSTIDMQVVAGTSATPKVIAGSIGNTELASGIQASKLQGYPSNSGLFLNGAGGWTSPSSGGQASIQFKDSGTNKGSAGAIQSVNFEAGLSASVSGTALTVWASTWFNVVHYGAVGNGSTDDTTAVQAAITAAIAAGGGTVYFPPGTYKITSTLTMSIGINLIGEGSTRTRTASRSASSIIKWAGSAGGTMISLTGNIGGMQWQGLQFDGNSIAAVCWYFESVFASQFQHCGIFNFTSHGIEINVPASSDGFTGNLLQNLDIESTTSGAIGIYETAANHSTNMCHNVFQNLFIVHGSRAISLGWSDNNDFIQVFCYRAAGSSADVLLQGPASTPSGDGCDTVRFYHLEGALELEDGVTACSVYGYDQSNAQPDPVVTGDAQLVVFGSNGLKVTSAPTTGSTVTLTPISPFSTFIVPPAGTLAALTIALTKGAMNGQRVSILVTQAVTTFTSPGSGTYVALPTSLTAGQKLNFVWSGVSGGAGNWYYLGG